MWIFTRHGFFSVVKHNMMPGMLVVRARCKADIDKLTEFLKSKSFFVVPFESKTNDYHYRVICTYAAFKAVVADVIDDIDYCNFKDEIHNQNDKSRDNAYMSVWRAMNDFQYEKENPNKHSRVWGFSSNFLDDTELEDDDLIIGNNALLEAVHEDNEFKERVRRQKLRYGRKQKKSKKHSTSIQVELYGDEA